MATGDDFMGELPLETHADGEEFSFPSDDPSAPTFVIDVPDGAYDPSLAPAPASEGSLSLNWCHQCKVKKQVAQCHNRRPRCLKRYCEPCLKNHYEEDHEAAAADGWLCPCCRSLCVCASCKRKTAALLATGDGAAAPDAAAAPDVAAIQALHGPAAVYGPSPGPQVAPLATPVVGPFAGPLDPAAVAAVPIVDGSLVPAGEEALVLPPPPKPRPREPSARMPYKCSKCGQPKQGHVCLGSQPPFMSPAMVQARQAAFLPPSASAAPALEQLVRLPRETLRAALAARGVWSSLETEAWELADALVKAWTSLPPPQGPAPTFWPAPASAPAAPPGTEDGSGAGPSHLPAGAPGPPHPPAGGQGAHAAMGAPGAPFNPSVPNWRGLGTVALVDEGVAMFCGHLDGQEGSTAPLDAGPGPEGEAAAVPGQPLAPDCAEALPGPPPGGELADFRQWPGADDDSAGDPSAHSAKRLRAH